FRVLSVGCGAGEEAYSIAYRLGQGAAAGGPRAEVTGIDLSPRCIADARRGEYREPSLRGVPEAERERWFDFREGRFAVRPEWRQDVRFEQGNLLELELPEGRGADAVFCRNVLLYLGESARRKVVELLHETLTDGGVLFVGHSESLHGLTRAFRPVTFRRAWATARACPEWRRN